MKYTLLYDPDVEEARAFISHFDGKGEILSTPEECVNRGYRFGSSPTIIYEDSKGVIHTCTKPTSWQEVESWASFIELKNSVPVTPVTQTEFTKTEFKRLFMLEELNNLIIVNETPLGEKPLSDEDLAPGDILTPEQVASLEVWEGRLNVKRMWNILSDSEFVSLKDPLTVNSLYLLVLGGYITEARFDEIKRGVTKI